MREAFFVNRSPQFDTVALLDLPQQVCEVGSPGAFYEQQTIDDKLERSEERLVRELVSVLDKVLLEALSTRSVDEFVNTRKKVWARYIRAVRALSDTINNLMSKEARDETIKQAMSSLDASFQRQEERFGEVLTEQAIFTVWTFGRMRSLAHEIVSKILPKESRQADLALLHECTVNGYWASFHIDLLIAAMKFDRPLPEELREMVRGGLRAAPNAYAIMKEALLLRSPRTEETPEPSFIWDEEDEHLLASSMRDLNGDLSDYGNNTR